MARGLAPVGSRSGPNPDTTVFQIDRVTRIYDCFQPNGAVRRSDKPPRHNRTAVHHCTASPQTSAINAAKQLPMAFKLIEHVTGDLILREAHQVIVLAAVVQVHLGAVVTRARLIGTFG